MVTISGLCCHTQKLSENCIYALAATRKRQVAPERLLQTHSTFSKSVMVSMLPIDLIFIDARVKTNDVYYCKVFLTQKLLPVMRVICGEFFIFQQRNVPAHRACGTINLLKRDNCVRFTGPFATKQHRSEPRWLQKYEDKCSSWYCKFMMSMN